MIITLLGLCVGPQHQIMVGGHAGCSVVPCPFLRRGLVIEQSFVFICNLLIESYDFIVLIGDR